MNNLSKQNAEQLPKRFIELKPSIEELPLKAKIYLSMLCNLVSETEEFPVSKSFKKAHRLFINSFAKQLALDKIYFVIRNIEFAQNHIKKNQEIESKSNSYMNQIKQIETTCSVKDNFLGVTHWEKKGFKLNACLLRVRLCTKNKEDLIDLRNYFMRKSLKDKCTIVLDAIMEGIPEKLQKISMYFESKEIFNTIYENLRECMLQTSFMIVQCFCNEFSISSSLPLLEEQSTVHLSKINKELMILSQTNISDFFNSKDKIKKKLEARKWDQVIFQNDTTQCCKDEQDSNSYKLQKVYYHASLEEIKQSISIVSRQPIRNLKSCEKLETFSSNITANYFIYEIGKKAHEFLAIVEDINKKEEFSTTLKAVQKIVENKIKFISVTISKGKKASEMKVNIFCIVNMKSKKKDQNVIDFLSGLVESQAILSTKQINQIQHKGENDEKIAEHSQNQDEDQIQEFYTVHDLERDEDSISQNFELKLALQEFSPKKTSLEQVDLEKTLKIEFKKNKSLDQLEFEEVRSTKTKKKQQEKLTFLTVRAADFPKNPNELKKRVKEDFLFGDWEKSKKGGLICIDEAVINEQKKVFKLILTQMGSNLLKNKSLMNISMPVQIFKKQSLLISLARNLSFAPDLLEPAANAVSLQKMKRATLLQVSISCLSLSTQKPFNPILGETYQGEIDGCPIFLEQICHHPPISYLYMVGRGYKIYGDFQPKVSVRLNSAKGVNEKYLKVAYDNGGVIEINPASMTINGMLFGERNIIYEGTTYAIDIENLLISEIYFGSKKNSSKLPNEDSPDFVSGFIYSVTPTFMSTFLKNKRNISPKKDEKSAILSSFHGTWNGIMYLDEKQVINFEKDLPLLLQNNEHCLPSDSVHRSDVHYLMKQDMQKSQEQKDYLEEIQRNDRKMREQHEKSIRH